MYPQSLQVFSEDSERRGSTPLVRGDLTNLSHNVLPYWDARGDGRDVLLQGCVKWEGHGVVPSLVGVVDAGKEASQRPHVGETVRAAAHVGVVPGWKLVEAESGDKSGIGGVFWVLLQP